jgi:hypothetical protein
MAAFGTYDFPDHKSGDTFPGVIFRLTDGEGEPIPLDNCIIDFHLFPDGEVALSTESEGGVTILSDSSEDDGRFMIDEQIIDWRPRTYRYEIIFTFPSGKVHTYVEGHWLITE